MLTVEGVDAVNELVYSVSSQAESQVDSESEVYAEELAELLPVMREYRCVVESVDGDDTRISVVTRSSR